ncbi:putative Vesicle-fusing ATPase [Blattamonas nauphoetae]|uniref:Vesicle-fusing ATPase n=1 Tax=Blattamonas nauphoetae TaxID=2049346 RepID=A0ABQ9XFD3_9EUKA|nr:putative Vesicle-fusing ATPase [Blattamonas nauphoetae]
MTQKLKLSITKPSSPQQVLTNMVFIHKDAFKTLFEKVRLAPGNKPLVRIVSAEQSSSTPIPVFYYIEAASGCEAEQIMLNPLQRDLLGEEGKMVEVEVASVNIFPQATDLTMTIQPFNAKQGKKVEFKGEELRNILFSNFEDHILKLNQGLMVSIDKKNYIMRSLTYQVKAANRDAKEQAVAELMGKTTTAGNKDVPFRLCKETKVIFSTDPRGLVSVKEATKGMDLFKENVSAESLGIGGLSTELHEIVRRTLLSRTLSAEEEQELQATHVRGLLLYGPPGTGKTLIARQIGKMLNTREPVVVSGPEILNKYVGQSEENIRKLFAEAEKDLQENGDLSDLHLIIFDEIDAICKARGTSSGGTGVGDSVVNQLLSKMDGINSLNNILVIGMTNRKDLIDPALLRPGRFEVHIEIPLPDETGRLEILRIHTKRIRDGNYMSPDVDLADIARRAKNYSGAELEGVVKSALSRAIDRKVSAQHANTILGDVSRNDQPTPQSENRIVVLPSDFLSALDEVHPQFGTVESDLHLFMQSGIVRYGPEFDSIASRILSLLRPDVKGRIDMNQWVQRVPPIAGDRQSWSTGSWTRSLLLAGQKGTGSTALAAYIAQISGYPFVRIVTPGSITSKGSDINSFQRIITDVFQDALKSPWALVVLDGYDHFIRFTNHANYNQSIAYALSDWIHYVPQEGHRLFIIATTSRYEQLHGEPDAFTSLIDLEEERAAMESRRSEMQDDSDLVEILEMDKRTEKGTSDNSLLNPFTTIIPVPPIVKKESIATVLKEINPSRSTDSVEKMSSLLHSKGSIGIKKLMQLAEGQKGSQ